MKRGYQNIFLFLVILAFGCSKKDSGGGTYTPLPKPLILLSAKLNDKAALITTQTLASFNQNINWQVNVRTYYVTAVPV